MDTITEPVQECSSPRPLCAHVEPTTRTKTPRGTYAKGGWRCIAYAAEGSAYCPVHASLYRTKGAPSPETSTEVQP